MTRAELGTLLIRAVGTHNAAVSMLGKLSPTDPAEAPFHALALRICDRYAQALCYLGDSDDNCLVRATRALTDVVTMYEEGPFGRRAVPL